MLGNMTFRCSKQLVNMIIDLARAKSEALDNI